MSPTHAVSLFHLLTYVFSSLVTYVSSTVHTLAYTGTCVNVGCKYAAFVLLGAALLYFVYACFVYKATYADSHNAANLTLLHTLHCCRTRCNTSTDRRAEEVDV